MADGVLANTSVAVVSSVSFAYRCWSCAGVVWGENDRD